MVEEQARYIWKQNLRQKKGKRLGQIALSPAVGSIVARDDYLESDLANARTVLLLVLSPNPSCSPRGGAPAQGCRLQCRVQGLLLSDKSIFADLHSGCLQALSANRLSTT